jgi:hypothetical protein
VFPKWLRFLKRSPRAGDRKDPIMSQPTESPGTTVVPPPPPPPDVAAQIAQLTDAVNRLVQAQQAAKPTAAPAPAAPVPAAHVASDISGEIPGGHPPRAAIDVARLSPLQQITLGLRDAKPASPTTTPAAPDGAD